MKQFYRSMLWAAQFEYTIGKSTGMRHRHLHALSRDISKWRGKLNWMELQR